MRTHTLLLSFHTLYYNKYFREVNTAAVGSVLRFFHLHRMATLRLAQPFVIQLVVDDADVIVAFGVCILFFSWLLPLRCADRAPDPHSRHVGSTFVGSGMRPDRGAHERVRSRLSRRLHVISGVFHPRPQGADVFPVTVSTPMSHPPRAHSPRPRRLLSSAFCWSWSRCVRSCAHALSAFRVFARLASIVGDSLLQFGGRARRVYFLLEPSTVLCGRPVYTPQRNPPSLAFLPAPTSNLFVSRIRTLFQLKLLSALPQHQRLRLAASAPGLWEIMFKLSPYLNPGVALFSSVFR
ncbi:hypothetical protein B0H11DRAFT_2111057 [Mycena galericulata]|nr:hypothetical protein B0H11DRAFT_2111057 [Mycena galericulata]